MLVEVGRKSPRLVGENVTTSVHCVNQGCNDSCDAALSKNQATLLVGPLPLQRVGEGNF